MVLKSLPDLQIVGLNKIRERNTGASDLVRYVHPRQSRIDVYSVQLRRLLYSQTVDRTRRPHRALQIVGVVIARPFHLVPQEVHPSQPHRVEAQLSAVSALCDVLQVVAVCTATAMQQASTAINYRNAHL